MFGSVTATQFSGRGWIGAAWTALAESNCSSSLESSSALESGNQESFFIVSLIVNFC